MVPTLNATFDGKAFVLNEPVDLPVNTRARVIVEREPSGNGEQPAPYSFLDVLANAHLDGPTDLSENLDEYLYPGKPWPKMPASSWIRRLHWL